MHPTSPHWDSDWIIPQWPAPAGVRAVCTSRAGGVSHAPYHSLNLGSHVGDDLAHVQHNRNVLQQALGVAGVYLNQVHGVAVATLLPSSPDGLIADACTTREHQLACTIMVADCLPILLCDTHGTQVAAVHAGWRSLAGDANGGVIEATCKHFAPNADLLAWLGPCIGPKAFEVGEEVRAAFVAHHAAAQTCFTPRSNGKWLANLPALARLRLHLLGIEAIYGNDASDAWCTVSNPSRFFSHRRDRISGRQAACIWLD